MDTRGGLDDEAGTPLLIAGRYEIERELGKGGMGRVVVALDHKLGRKVAIKMLIAGLRGEQALRRFEQEARAAGSLNHPNILDVHDIGNWEGEPYIVSEFLEGVTLAERIRQGPLPPEETAQLALQLAQGLCAAHGKGIVHRDLKPENLFCTSDGRLKILDFGIAKLVAPTQPETVPSFRPHTEAGAILGTIPYMSPEQVRGEPVDHRSDLFSCGVILCEALVGRSVFGRATPAETGYAILNEAPPDLPARVPPDLQSIVRRCLEKKPQERFQSAHDLQLALERISRGGPARPRRSTRIALLAAVAAAIVALALWFIRRESQLRWAHEQAIPRIAELVEKGRYSEAFALGVEAEKVVPTDPRLTKLWPEMSRDYNVETTPGGADIYTREYTAGEDAWRYLGRSPVRNARLPIGLHRWRIEKDGFATVEAASAGWKQFPLLAFARETTLRFALDKADAVPKGMVRVPAGAASLLDLGLGQLSVELPAYFLDRTEVTNREYKQFIDAGGYRRRELWKRDFIRDGKALPWDEAIASFRDRTGRPGPSTWMSGDYPEGQAEFPVTGVSWFEADAYAAFVGKALPTVYHWTQAAGLPLTSYLVPLSNFESAGPAAVGSHRGIGPHGTYDMAGNAREWCWNAAGDKRFILGGSWSDAAYVMSHPIRQSPFDRSPNNGFRLARYEGIPAQATDPIHIEERDHRKETPVSDDLFKAFKSLYSYDKTDLQAVVESVDDTSDRWRKERVSFAAAYARERVIAYLFLPRNIRPPYQTVVVFPGGNVFDLRSSNDLSLFLMGFLVKSGRAMLYPLYKGTYERSEGRNLNYSAAPTAFYRDHVLQWSKDLGRSLDYIGTRADLDAGKIALYGLSAGARLAPLLSAVDERIRVAVLVGGGLSSLTMLPEVNPLNFASRVSQPVLMINGRYDAIFSLDKGQRPLFDLLRVAAPDNKRHVVTDSDHLPPSDVVIRETLEWLDRYLGPVQQAGP